MEDMLCKEIMEECIYGTKRKSANVTNGWIIKTVYDVPELTTIFVK